MISGTIYWPPQPRSGSAVDEDPKDTNIHAETKRSPRTFAYDVKTSARSMSPNFPSCASAIRPMLTRLRVERNQYRPVRDSCWNGTIKRTTRRNR